MVRFQTCGVREQCVGVFACDVSVLSFGLVCCQCRLLSSVDLRRGKGAERPGMYVNRPGVLLSATNFDINDTQSVLPLEALYDRSSTFDPGVSD